MDKIKIKLNQSEWLTLTALVLQAGIDQREDPDKYTRIVKCELLRQIYVKLHNRMHSLKSKRVNGLLLSVPEAAIFNQVFGYDDLFAMQPHSFAIVIEMVGIIDQKLT